MIAVISDYAVEIMVGGSVVLVSLLWMTYKCKDTNNSTLSDAQAACDALRQELKAKAVDIADIEDKHAVDRAEIVRKAREELDEVKTNLFQTQTTRRQQKEEHDTATQQKDEQLGSLRSALEKIKGHRATMGQQNIASLIKDKQRLVESQQAALRQTKRLRRELSRLKDESGTLKKFKTECERLRKQQASSNKAPRANSKQCGKACLDLRMRVQSAEKIRKQLEVNVVKRDREKNALSMKLKTATKNHKFQIKKLNADLGCARKRVRDMEAAKNMMRERHTADTQQVHHGRVCTSYPLSFPVPHTSLVEPRGHEANVPVCRGHNDAVRTIRVQPHSHLAALVRNQEEQRTEIVHQIQAQPRVDRIYDSLSFSRSAVLCDEARLRIHQPRCRHLVRCVSRDRRHRDQLGYHIFVHSFGHVPQCLPRAADVPHAVRGAQVLRAQLQRHMQGTRRNDCFRDAAGPRHDRNHFARRAASL